jgi:hypothetical protein
MHGVSWLRRSSEFEHELLIVTSAGAEKRALRSFVEDVNRPDNVFIRAAPVFLAFGAARSFRFDGRFVQEDAMALSVIISTYVAGWGNPAPTTYCTKFTYIMIIDALYRIAVVHGRDLR